MNRKNTSAMTLVSPIMNRETFYICSNKTSLNSLISIHTFKYNKNNNKREMNNNNSRKIINKKIMVKTLVGDV